MNFWRLIIFGLILLFCRSFPLSEVISIDVLPSKNQALCKYCINLKHLISLLAFLRFKSREKGLITKGRKVTDMHLKLFLNGLLHFSKYILTVVQSCFKPSLISQHYKSVLFQTIRHPYHF